jgi:hypothetical protein
MNQTHFSGFYGRRWREAVLAKMQAGYDRERAILQVEKEQPELRREFLKEINPHARHRFNVR